MRLVFEAYKHKPEDSRILFKIDLNCPSLGVKSSANIIFSEGLEVPASLEDYLLLYAQKHRQQYAFTTDAEALRSIRKRTKTIRADPGYPSLAEVYAYVISQLREPVSHEELHTDISGYEERDLRLRMAADLSLLGE